jgi:hypothetical protein
MPPVDNTHTHVRDQKAGVEGRDWRSYVPEGVRPYIEAAPLAALCLGISSGFAYAMIGATLTTRLLQHRACPPFRDRKAALQHDDRFALAGRA